MQTKTSSLMDGKEYTELKAHPKTELSWLMNKTEQYSQRYIEAESFILELAEMKWYQRLFCFKKIMNFLISREKYGF